jgi:hypothetical protein
VAYGPTRHQWHRGRGGTVRRAAMARRRARGRPGYGVATSRTRAVRATKVFAVCSPFARRHGATLATNATGRSSWIRLIHDREHVSRITPAGVHTVEVTGSNPVLPKGRLVRETKRAPWGRCPPLSFLIRKRRRVRGTAAPCRASDRHHAGPESITLLRGRRSPFFRSSRRRVGAGGGL